MNFKKPLSVLTLFSLLSVGTAAASQLDQIVLIQGSSFEDGAILTEVVSADVNGDSLQDLIFLDELEENDRLRVVYGQNQMIVSEFLGEEVIELSGSVRGFQSGDVNGDGLDELYVRMIDGGEHWFTGTIDGLMESSLDALGHDDGSSVWTRTVGDINGDGVEDDYSNGLGYLEFRAEDGGQGERFYFMDFADYTVQSLGDVNGDGYDDLFVIPDRLYTESFVHIVYGGTDFVTGDNLSYNFDVSFSLGVFDGLGLADVDYFEAIGDTNGDGFDDFLVAGRFGDHKVVLVHGSDSFESEQWFGDYIQYTGLSDGIMGRNMIYVGDTNGDGLNEFIIGETSPRELGELHYYFVYGSN